MSDSVARRYAQALYQEAAAQKRLAEVDEDMALVRATMKSSQDLVRLFESPIVPREKKERAVQALFQNRVGPLMMRFLQLLINKEREQAFPGIVEAYRTLRDRQEGVVEARARVAGPLGDSDRRRLVDALERITGMNVRLEVAHEPGLLGGLVVRVGDTVYDGSVRHQLASLREQMERGASMTNGAESVPE